VTASDPYVPLATLKSKMGITETTRDADITASLLAAARVIDEYCARTFWQDATVSARIYRPYGRTTVIPVGPEYVLWTGDISTATGLIVEVGDGTTWETITSDVDVLDQGSAPYLGLVSPSRWSDPRARVTARWGWPSIPPQISEANLLLGARFWRRKDSPEGVLGSSEWGTIRVSRYDPDVDRLLRPFRRVAF